MTLRKIALFLLAACACFADLSHADAFREIKPRQLTTPGTRIEVIEFFFYDSPQCAAADPAVREWVGKQGSAITFRRMPVIWNNNEVGSTQMFYTFQAMGLEASLHPKALQAIHVDHIPLQTANEIAEWVTKQGVDRARWTDVFESGSVGQKVILSRTNFQPYGVDHVPSFVVDGKYYTDPQLAGQMPMLLKTLDELVAKAQAARRPKQS